MVIRRIINASLLISLGVLLGRMSGFLRESMLASILGIGSETDMAVLLFSLPDLLIGLLMGGAFSITFIPVFQKAEKTGQAASLYFLLSMKVAMIALLISFILFINSDLLARLLVPGFNLNLINNLSKFLEIVIWSFPLAALAGVTSAYLHANERFGVVAFGTLIFNGVVILGIIFVSLNDYSALLIFSISILVGSFLRWISQLVAIRIQVSEKINFTSLEKLPFNQNILERYFQVLIASASLLLIPYVARAVVSDNGAGQVAILNFSYKLVEFPLATVGTVFSIALFPLLSKAVRDGNDFREMLIPTLKVVLAITLATSLTLYVAAGVYTNLVYGWGKIEAEQLSNIEGLFRIFIVSLPFQSLIAIFSVALNSVERTSVVLKYNAITLLTFIILSYLSEYFGDTQYVAYSLVLSFLLGLSLYVFSFKNSHHISIKDVVSFRVLVCIVLFSMVFVLLSSMFIKMVVDSVIIAFISIFFLGFICFFVLMILLSRKKIRISRIIRL